MIVHKAFSKVHIINSGPRGLKLREELRELAEAFITREINEEDVINITESGDEYASAVTVWYQKR